MRLEAPKPVRVVSTWALISLAVLVGACAAEEAPPTAGDVLPDGVDYAFTRMRTFMTREGIRRARIEADTAEFVGENEVHMRPVKLIFFDQDGRESTELTADYGVYYELTEDMDAEGSVVVLDRADGQRLETERITYVNDEDRLYGDTAFRLYRDDGLTVIDGSAFESDPAMDSVIVLTPSGQTDRVLTPPSAPAPDPEATPSEPDTADNAVVDPDSTTAPPDTIPDSRQGTGHIRGSRSPSPLGRCINQYGITVKMI